MYISHIYNDYKSVQFNCHNYIDFELNRHQNRLIALYNHYCELEDVKSKIVPLGIRTRDLAIQAKICSSTCKPTLLASLFRLSSALVK